MRYSQDEIKEMLNDGTFKRLSLATRREILDYLRALHAEMRRQEIEAATAFTLTSNPN